MSILKKVFPIVFAVSLLAACGGGSSDSNDGPSDPTTPNVTTTAVSGTFVIPADFSLTPSSRAIANLTGNVIITIGDTQFAIPAANITLNASGDYLASFSENVDLSGITVITCTSALVADSTPIDFAGYLMTSLVEGQTTNINGNDGAAPITEVDLSGFTATAAPVFESFVVSTPTDGAFFTTFNATLSQLESDLVYVRVNNAYQPVNVNVSASGMATISAKSISLVPGSNEVQLFAINSKGYTASAVQTVTCTATNVAGKENFLFTLTWDNYSDIDLHTFYFATTPTATATPTWHAYWIYKNNPSDDAIINNLDVDNVVGFGPEHFTLLGAPDGYYIVAIDAYHVDYDVEKVNAFVTIAANNANKSYGPLPFTVDDGMDDEASMNTSASWHRIADIQVTGGVATILSPNMSISPAFTDMSESMRSVARRKK